ncbi:MAG: cytochrome C [Micavibrio aeruginosavorus]|uniref:Cytochrome C n=1 Tax=Micavibrio aeruginosavorus TaxID=349221 RepID=A0A2W5PN09_9BACT|nr:MAG: cytochrome C [Micavibrio aeruginosavorus]
MGSKERKAFDNPVIEWVDSRLPVFTLMQKEYGVFPTPKNFNYFWNFGAIAMVMLVTMIVTGITLAMHYNPSTAGAFDSVERIMRDVNHGWMIRYLHANGASFFFVAVYIHIFRGLFYGSYKQPRELLWILGMVIFLLMMATGFMGYVLPWGQMSYWGATVITNLFSAIPLVGDSIVTLLWGGFSVDNPTLNRMFALHYLLPFVIVGVVFLHVWALHVTGSNNPLGIDVKGEQDTLPFHPYYTMKDTFGVLVFLTIYAAFAFFLPNSLGHPDNYIPANPLVTPPHIVPEWYFLPFYAMLRAITFDFNLYLCGAGVIGGFLIYQYCWKKTPDKQVDDNLWILLVVAGILAVPGGLLAFFHDVPALKPVIEVIPFKSISLMPAKLGGVLTMFGSIGVLFVLPFIDSHPVRSAVYRPWFKPAVLVLLVVFLILGVCGSKPAEGYWVPLAQVMTLLYFGFFLVAIPYFNNNEPVKTLPTSIHMAILSGPKAVIVALMAIGLFVAVPNAAFAKADTAPEAMAPVEKTDAEKVPNGPEGAVADKAEDAPAVAAAEPEEVAPSTEAPAPTEAHASADAHHTAVPPKQDWPFNGPLGTYDRASLQRGFQVYKQVCAACHSMKRVAYRNLSALGYTEDQIKAVAAEATIMDGPNDEGEMFERPGRPSDHFKSPFANDNAAKANNNGALPPDLSLIVKARTGGADYVYAILTGYDTPPPGIELANGQHYNKYMAGNKIAMPAPLVEGAVAYEDNSPTTVNQYAHDVSQFLAWAAEPEMEERKQTGLKAIIFLVVFAGLMYAVKRKIWAKVH